MIYTESCLSESCVQLCFHCIFKLDNVPLKFLQVVNFDLLLHCNVLSIVDVCVLAIMCFHDKIQSMCFNYSQIKDSNLFFCDSLIFSTPLFNLMCPSSLFLLSAAFSSHPALLSVVWSADRSGCYTPTPTPPLFF